MAGHIRVAFGDQCGSPLLLIDSALGFVSGGQPPQPNRRK